MSHLSKLEEIISRRNFTDLEEDAQQVARKAIDQRVEKHQADALATWAAAGAILEDTHGLAQEQVWANQQFPEETLEAARLKYPNAYGPLSDEDIVSKVLAKTPDAREGFAQGVKGKIFEMRGVDTLNSGGSVGSISLEQGQYASLAPTGNPGADVVIYNADGTVAEAYSAKCTDEMSAVYESLRKYPDLPVVGAEEIGDEDEVVNSGISDDELEGDVLEQVDGDEAAEILETLEPLGDLAPGLPLLVVLYRHGKPVVMKEKTVRDALASALPDAGAAIAFAGIGGVLAFFDMGLLSIPVLFVGRHFYKKWKRQKVALRFSERALSQFHQIRNESSRYSQTLATAS